MNHSPTTAPITDKGIEILNAENKYGIAVKNLNFKNISNFEAFKIWKNLYLLLSTSLNPVNALINIGKNVIRNVMNIFGEYFDYRSLWIVFMHRTQVF